VIKTVQYTHLNRTKTSRYLLIIGRTAATAQRYGKVVTGRITRRSRAVSDFFLPVVILRDWLGRTSLK